MIERRPISVSLTPELHAFVSDLVASGGYGNASEVVRAGLRLLRHEEAARLRHGSKGAAASEHPPMRTGSGQGRRDVRG
ncbi:type II toxin-antitoxin system ParD family antitoxin [Methylobacterium sp. HMF5984]|uniref:type II toxin-antitoxin system ParD family antitoxin n=1 Tax=Methylobacterium sp. HMF5984 TaxID=3367370 RepID=UPI0038525232